MFSMPPPTQRRNLQALMVNALATPAIGAPQRRRNADLERQIFETAARSGTHFIDNRLRPEHSRQ